MEERPNAPRAFHVMTKPRGPICNLACAYCYYLPKAQMYPDSDFRMSDVTLETFTRQYIEAQRAPEVTFGWQGGEPLLMGIPFYERALELQERYRRPGTRIVNTLQTNGTLITPEWAAFFRKHNFLIGLSLDGPQEMHDSYRVDGAGRPTWASVIAGMRTLQAHGVEHNILCTVHAANAPHPLEVYRFFRDEARARFIQFIPIVRRVNTTGHQEGIDVTPSSVSSEQYGTFLIGVFDEWVRRDVGQVFVQIFDVALAAWTGERPGLCVFEPVCGLGLAMEHNGDVFSCDHFVEPRHLLGNIGETPLIDLVASEQQRQFGRAKLDTLPAQCVSCDVRFVCNGTCPKDRILTAPEGEPGLSYLCAGYKAFFHHIDRPMRMMVEELRHERAPANVMARMAAEDAAWEKALASTGRNDPCPCGSGRKFKHCHGRSR